MRAAAGHLDEFDALWIVPGTPYRDDRPVFAAIERARREGVPILGTCGGFQHMVVEFARNAAGIADAGHAESEPDAGALVIAPLAMQPGGRGADGDDRARNPGRASCAARRRLQAFTGAATASSRPISTAWSPRGWSSPRRPPMPASKRSSCPVTRSMSPPCSSRRWAAPRAERCIRSSPPSCGRRRRPFNRALARGGNSTSALFGRFSGTDVRHQPNRPRAHRGRRDLREVTRSRLRLPLGGGERATLGPDGRHVPGDRDRPGRHGLEPALARPRASSWR